MPPCSPAEQTHTLCSHSGALQPACACCLSGAWGTHLCTVILAKVTSGSGTHLCMVILAKVTSGIRGQGLGTHLWMVVLAKVTSGSGCRRAQMQPDAICAQTSDRLKTWDWNLVYFKDGFCSWHHAVIQSLASSLSVTLWHLLQFCFLAVSSVM